MKRCIGSLIIIFIIIYKFILIEKITCKYEFNLIVIYLFHLKIKIINRKSINRINCFNRVSNNL